MLAASRRLREADIDSAQLDAAVLLCSVLGVNKAWLYAHPTRQLTEHEIAVYEALVRRRMCHEPVAYLVGYKPFYGLDITVDNRVLIPRPETEMLVERALAHAQMLAREGQKPVVADIGTGSGAIAVAIAVNAPEAIVVCDRRFGRVHGGRREERLALRGGGAGAPLPRYRCSTPARAGRHHRRQFALCCDADLATLPPQVRNYEPVLALDGGPDGCDVIRTLLRSIATPGARPG